MTNEARFSSTSDGSGSDAAAFSIVAAPLPDLSGSTKSVSPAGDARAGDYLTYTITLVNSGTAQASVSLTDTLPGELLLLRGLDGGSSLTWSGSVSTGSQVQLTLVAQARPDLGSDVAVSNTVSVNYGADELLLLHSPDTMLLAGGYYVYLPLVLRGY